MPVFQNIGSGEGIVFHRLVDGKTGRNGQQQVFFAKEAFAVDCRVHVLVVDQKVQGAGKQLFGQL